MMKKFADFLIENTSVLTEASLTRVWQHTQSDRPYALFTGFRNEKTLQQNIQSNREISIALKKAGFGFFFVDGAWIETNEDGTKTEVREDSIFAIGEPGKEKTFLDLIVSLGKKYNQDGVLVRTGDLIAIYDKQGKAVQKFSKLRIGQLGSFYTKLRTNKQANTFVFESERDSDMSFFGSWIDSLKENE